MPQRSIFFLFDTGLALHGGRQRARALMCRGLLWILLFSAFQGLLGALLVSTLASGPVTEVCTPQGMQWVSMERAAESNDAPAPVPGLGPTCAWCMAHVAVLVDSSGNLPSHLVAAPQVLPGLHGVDATHSSDRRDRVLLMAPMRAPPPWWS